MEYLTRLIKYATDRWPFQYHPLCKSLKLTHLMFADDLLLFCKGNAQSIILLMKAFSSFSSASGLTMNSSKSEIFFNGMNEDLKEGIKSVTGFKEGDMPFGYLGVPIQTGRLSKKDYSALTEKMVSKIRGLGAKNLSYSGRVVLINSVLNTLYNYWAQLFIIPKSVIKRIEAICENYLWDMSPYYHRVPLVAWDKLIGSIQSRDGLWIGWVHDVHLKDKDWHDYAPPNDATWVWKHICKVKEKLKDGFVDGSWISHPQGYSIRRGYDWLKPTQNPQPWHSVVWNNWNTPKQSLISWLILQGGMNTKEKLHKIGYCTDDRCLLCDSMPETIDHLFSSCIYSCKVKHLLENWIGSNMPTVSHLAASVTDSVVQRKTMIEETAKGRIKLKLGQALVMARVDCLKFLGL
ncbi:uncharacterized protein LOC141640982 [Silene latifolia]|uniref:uncharacterized protein LOC141640982 n=1 Tax=Silene latifolia TaxID=37657 RepID=UPI003D77CC95